MASIESFVLSDTCGRPLRPAHQVSQIWEKKACAWATGNLIENYHVRRVERKVEMLAKRLPSRTRILELASGSNNRRYYPPRFDFRQVTAVDISKTMLDFLGFENPGVKNKIIADARAFLPFLDNSFGLALCFFGMRYFENQEEILNELARVVIPGGCLGIADYDNYIYEDSVRAFNVCRLEDEVRKAGHFASVDRLAKPLCQGDPTLYFLAIEVNKSF